MPAAGPSRGAPAGTGPGTRSVAGAAAPALLLRGPRGGPVLRRRTQTLRPSRPRPAAAAAS